MPKKQDLEDESDDTNSTEDTTSSDKYPAQEKEEAVDGIPATQSSPVQQPAPSTSDTIQQLLAGKTKELQDAQDQRNYMQVLTGLGQSANTIGASLAHVKADNSGYAPLFQLANQPLSDLEHKQTMQQRELHNQSLKAQLTNDLAKEDPNSDISKLGRNLAQESLGRAKFDINIPENISLSNLEKIMPGIENMANRQVQMSNQQQIRSDKLDEKNRVEDEKTQAEIQRRLNSLSQSSRSSIGKAAQAKVSANRLLDIVKDPNSTEQDLQSAYSDLNQIVSGTSTMSGTEHQSYKTLFGQFSKAMTYITGQPNAPLIPEIKKHVADVATRMNKISDNVINNNTQSVKSGYSAWADRHPEQMQTMIGAALSNSPTELIIQKTSPEDEKAVKWAKDNPNDPNAQKILNLHGM